MFNSLNWTSFNIETLGFLNNNPEAQITIGTDALSVGINSPAQTVVIFGVPSSPEDSAQKFGRIRPKTLGNARGIIYLPRGSAAAAQKAVEADQRATVQIQSVVPANPGERHGNIKSKKQPMDLGMARLILAPCKPAQFDVKFDNPVNDELCKCLGCQQNPPLPCKENCDCSGCQPEEKPKRKQNAPKKSTVSVPSKTVLTVEMQKLITKRLVAFRKEVWDSADKIRYSFLPPDAFLPDDLIKSLLNNFFLIRTLEDLIHIVQKNKLLDNHHHTLFAVLENLQAFVDMIEKEHENDAQGLEEESAEESADTSDSDDEGEVTVVDGKIKWRLNAS
jgi:hypothetical protein